MTKVINLTPHAIHVYKAEQFQGLEQSNPTTWVADGVSGDPVETYDAPSQPARIKTSTRMVKSSLPGEVVATEYGEATGIPEGLKGSETLIVSLPMQGMARQAGLGCANQMVAPYKVVRLRKNPSQVLGCMGFTY